MQSVYWQSWWTFLERWGLVEPAYAFVNSAQPLLPFASQLMLLGMPLFKGAALGDAYSALLDLLGDEEKIKQFFDGARGLKG